MTEKSWIEKRKRIRLDIAKAFASRSSIGEKEFLATFYDAKPPPPIGDFNSQYLSDAAVREEIFTALGEAIGLKSTKMEYHYRKEESFAQFGEHLLRVGAYAEDDD